MSTDPEDPRTGRTAPCARLTALAGELQRVLGPSATVETGRAGPYRSVWLQPSRPGALGVGWLESDVEVVLQTDGDPGGRWELEPVADDLDLLEDIVRAVVAGRVTVRSAPGRTLVEVTLQDGTVESSTVRVAPGGLVPRPGWRRARRTSCAPYEP